MLLLDLIEWIHDHPGEAIFRSLIIVLLRNIIVLAKEEEVHWIRERVERLTGERYPGHTKRLWRRAVRSLKILFLYLPKAYRRGNPRRITVNNQTNWYTLIPALIGVLKLVLQPFGIDLSKVTDDQVNAVVNGAAALIAVWGVFKSHTKPTQPLQPNSKNFIQG